MAAFFELSPERVLDLVESAASGMTEGRKATGRAWPLNSIENRVYEIEFEDDLRLVAKFYRPGRWRVEEIMEEHRFLEALFDAQIPVLTHIKLQSLPGEPFRCASPTLGVSNDGIFFCISPRIKARCCDELSDEQLAMAGRFLGRIHAVGRGMPRLKRKTLSLEVYGDESLRLLARYQLGLEHRELNALKDRYVQYASQILTSLRLGSQSFESQNIHGDCHVGNLLWQHEQPIFLDFDDCLWGPKVQDLWMLVAAGNREEAKNEETLLGAYRQMADVSESDWQSREILRILRMIHFNAWIAGRWDDPAFPRIFPEFGSEKWWSEEIDALSRSFERHQSLKGNL